MDQCFICICLYAHKQHTQGVYLYLPVSHCFIMNAFYLHESVFEESAGTRKRLPRDTAPNKSLLDQVISLNIFRAVLKEIQSLSQIFASHRGRYCLSSDSKMHVCRIQNMVKMHDWYLPCPNVSQTGRVGKFTNVPSLHWTRP